MKEILEIIPAIDMKGGRCVRLVQGQMDQETVYYQDPVDAAKLWASQGAPRIHLVDLDGAVAGSPQNMAVVERIVGEVAVPVQLGGGIRGQDEIKRCLDIGVDRVILGTLAFRDPERVKTLADLYPGKILLGLDARDGYLAIEGWQDVTRVRVTDLLSSYPSLPIAGIIYTDIKRDGMLKGPNIPATRDLLEISPYPVIASGGVTSPKDVAGLARLKPLGLVGAIIGKALYSGQITYPEALETARHIDNGGQ